MNLTRPLVLAIVMMICLSPDSAQANGTSLNEFSLELSDEAREAVNAGVTFSFTVDFAVLKSWGIFTRETQTKSHRITLLRHALSNRYIVKLDNKDMPHIFRSVAQALNFIAAQSRNMLELYSTPELLYSMRISLNKFELPTPLRLKAFLTPAWDIDTGWIKWASAN